MRIRSLIIPILFFAVMTLSGCGGGGGGDTAATNPSENPTIPADGTTNATPAPTSGLLKLSTSGATALMAGIDVTVNLPDGVILDADPLTGAVTSGVVTVSGAAAIGNNNLAVAKFKPASIGAPAQVHVIIVNVAGFNPGEFATIQFNLATGASLPLSSQFSVASILAKGLDGSGLSGVTAAPPSVEGI